MEPMKDLHNSGDINIVKMTWVLGILSLDIQTLIKGPSCPASIWMETASDIELLVIVLAATSDRIAQVHLGSLATNVVDEATSTILILLKPRLLFCVFDPLEAHALSTLLFER